MSKRIDFQMSQWIKKCNMLSKNTIILLKSLHTKEWRKSSWLFLVEWEKNILEFLASNFQFQEWYFMEWFVEKNKEILQKISFSIVTQKEIEKITTLEKNNVWVAVFRQKQYQNIDKVDGITLVLDSIKDPGNLGTIIRTADWYGVKRIIASEDCVDIYNPKVIMSSMWSLSRMSIWYEDAKMFLKRIKLPIYWAYLEWKNIHTMTSFPKDVIIVIWSESHGISKDVESYITHKLTIPRFGHAESLNAWIATAVILDNFISKMETKKI